LFIIDKTQSSQSGGREVKMETEKISLVVRGFLGLTRELRFF
jgi:hypothetical protein